MKKSYLTLDLQLFAEGEEETGVDSVPAAEEQETQETEVTESESGADEEVAAEPEKQNNFEKAFAKRLSAEREKWEVDKQAELQKVQDQFKDYDVSKKAMEYLMKSNGINDAMSLKEQIELAELNERAENENVSPEVLKRIDELEAKSAKLDALEAEKEQTSQYQTFRTELDKFAKEHEVEPDQLHQFMFENQIGKMDVALRAMKSEENETKLKTAKEDAIKEYLESKKAPRVEGSGTAGAIEQDTSKMGWGDITRAAAERVRASLTKE